MQLSGFITGTLGYSLKRDFLANAIAFRDVETFNYEIYSVDFAGMSANTIQNQIKNQFSSVYSGDIHVSVFDTQNSYSYPSDSIRASKFNVVVEIKKPVSNLSTVFPELSGNYYQGLDSAFWTNNGQYLLDFKESFTFATNANGNREFNHDISFGLQTGWAGSDTVLGRRTFSQNLASGIFANDKNTTFGLYTMVGQAASVSDSGQFRNYYNESYDLIKNTYGFSRKREILPFSDTNIILNLSNSISMNENGLIDVSEKATTQGKIDFPLAKTSLDSYLASSYSRCQNVYNEFYNTGIIIGDTVYLSGGLTYPSVLPLINTPVKTVKFYDSRSLSANYDVSYTNNPNYSGDATMTSQSIEFNIDAFNKVEATHSFDFTVNKVIHDSSYFSTLMNNVTGSSPTTISNYYSTIPFSSVKAMYPNINLVKNSASLPNIKTKSSVKFLYSNNPSYFLTVNGVQFRIFDYTVEETKPVDIVQEYKIINRPTKKSILSYAYQTEKGQISINFKISLGKDSSQFYPDYVGNFAATNASLQTKMQAVYKFGGQLFLTKFNYPIVALNWFISDSRFSLDSDGDLGVQLNYTYTLKKRPAPNYP